MGDELVNGMFPKELLEWISKDGPAVDEEVSKAIDRVCQDRSKVAELFLSAVVKKHIERIVYYFGKLPEIEARVYSTQRLATAETKDLIRLLACTWEQINESLEFLKTFVSKDQLSSPPVTTPAAMEAVSDTDKKIIEALGVSGRYRLRKLLQKALDTKPEEEPKTP